MYRIALMAAILGILLATPSVMAHGALTLNEFDTYAISDFEGHEESFAWEGWEIWDVYVGDGYNLQHDSHGVYFKANFAGDGTLRPLGGQSWELTFTFMVGGAIHERSIVHDGSTVATDFDALDWQVADGNVFQIHAWALVPEWQDLSVSDLVVVSSVDGAPRDTAPGGIHDPVTGAEIPVNVPPDPHLPRDGRRPDRGNGALDRVGQVPRRHRDA